MDQPKNYKGQPISRSVKTRIHIRKEVKAVGIPTLRISRMISHD